MADHRGYLQYINQRAAGLLKLTNNRARGVSRTQLLTLPARSSALSPIANRCNTSKSPSKVSDNLSPHW